MNIERILGCEEDDMNKKKGFRCVVGLFSNVGLGCLVRYWPKCSEQGSQDQSNCNSLWSSLCTNCPSSPEFNHRPMAGRTTVSKLWQADIITMI